MEIAENLENNDLNIKNNKVKTGKIVITIILALIPIVLSGIITFINFPLGGLLTTFIGIVIGVSLIPFMLFITQCENWSRKWYIWLTIIAIITTVFVLPLFKSNASADGMGSPRSGDVRMEKAMY